MEYAARRFARWVLFIHALLLLCVAMLISMAARQVYNSSRQQAIEQAARRQTLLAEQTARGIESYYSSIIDNFELLRRTEAADIVPPDPIRARALAEVSRLLFAPALWNQLENRASDFLILDHATLDISVGFPKDRTESARQLVRQSASWLRGITEPAVSPLIKLNGEDVNLVCVPVIGAGRHLLVAVVPLRKIRQQFLDTVNAEANMSALLLDEDVRVMAAFDQDMVGLSLADDSSNEQVRALATRYMLHGRSGTEVIREGFTLGSVPLDGGIVSVHPIDLRGKRWWLSLGASFEEVDSVVEATFRGTIRWAIFVAGSITAILVSTAFQMIRSRVRLERARHEALTKELTQARTIQLAWLPNNDDDPPHIDLCAINKPASHISGDFYNWFDLPDERVCVVIGDVTGHGMAAAFLMATTQLLVRMVMMRGADLSRCLEEVNRQLCRQAFYGQFVTMQMLILDRNNGRIEVASAGHPPPLLGGESGYRPFSMQTDLVLGVNPDTKYRTHSFDLPNGANIVLYTDGVIEAADLSGDRFGVERLVHCLNAGSFDNAQSIVDQILASVDRFRGERELSDDLTLVTIQLDPVPHQARSVAATI